jgi:hypothetical protein
VLHWHGGGWEFWSGSLVGDGELWMLHWQGGACWSGTLVGDWELRSVTLAGRGCEFWSGTLVGVWELWSVRLAGRGLGFLECYIVWGGGGVVECYLDREAAGSFGELQGGGWEFWSVSVTLQRG